MPGPSDGEGLHILPEAARKGFSGKCGEADKNLCMFCLGLKSPFCTSFADTRETRLETRTVSRK